MAPDSRVPYVRSPSKNEVLRSIRKTAGEAMVASARGHARSACNPPWSQREREWLAATWDLLRKHGYTGLTVDAVAAKAHASKATVYRRWQSKAKLVTAACVEGFLVDYAAPDTGTLRGDLVAVGVLTRRHLMSRLGVLKAIIFELGRQPELRASIQSAFVGGYKPLLLEVIQRAVDRGDIAPHAFDDQLWDVLPALVITRSLLLVPGPTNRRIIETLIDEMVLPGLRRHELVPRLS